MPGCARFACIALLLAIAAPASARMLHYRMDPVHTQVLFSVDHDGYSHPVGRMKIKAGWIAFDEDDWSTAKVVADVDATSVDIGDKDWNDAVTGKRFLDAKDYPLAHFESTSVEKTDAQHGTLHGNLTLRGATREVAIPFTLNRIGATIFAGMQTLAGFSAQATLDRLQFGMTSFPKAVGTQVQVRLEVEAILDQDAQKEYEATMRKDANHAAQH
ncbi:MAG TPA: YceI family protein [Rhodanobacteraceae bacterium]|nr:YceI family protein [Rhodanobacteraceae bacterium]